MDEVTDVEGAFPESLFQMLSIRKAKDKMVTQRQRNQRIQNHMSNVIASLADESDDYSFDELMASIDECKSKEDLQDMALVLRLLMVKVKGEFEASFLEGKQTTFKALLKLTNTYEKIDEVFNFVLKVIVPFSSS